MAERSDAIDIEQSEQAETDAQRAAGGANLFDLRRIIGGAVRGLRRDPRPSSGWASPTRRSRRPPDININLYAGLGDARHRRRCFLAWAFTRPLGEELARPSASQSTARAAGPAATGDGAVGRRGAGRQQGEHRAAEAAADHPGAGGAGAP